MKDLNKLNSLEFYQKVGAKQGWNFSKLKYQKFESKNFNYYKFLEENINPSDVILDIGCGDSRKVIQYVNAKEIIGIDNSAEMLKKSEENLKLSDKKTSHKFILMDGNSKLNFGNESFDFVINRHCGCNISEMKRVLKLNGVYIQEDIDETDCLELKVLFNRGQCYPIKNRASDEMWKQYETLGFSKFEYYPIREIEYYETEDDLKYLLKNTPIIPNFGEGENDEALFKQFCQSHRTNKGIRLDRELFAFIVVK